MPGALLLHGKLDGWERGLHYVGPTPRGGWDVSPHSSLISFVRFLAPQMIARVIQPNKLDVFIHSWNGAAVGAAMDHAYKPIASLHEIAHISTAVISQSVSIARAFRMAKTHKDYDIFTVVRHDVLFYSEVNLAHLPQSTLHLPSWCSNAFNLTLHEISALKPVCSWGSKWYLGESYIMRPVTLSHTLHARGLQNSMTDYNLAVLDWWFVGTPAAVTAIASVGRRFTDYRHGMSLYGHLPAHAHHFWAWVIHHVLNSSNVNFLPLFEGVDFRLGRHWRKGSACFVKVTHRRAGKLARLATTHVGNIETLSRRQCAPDNRHPGGLRVVCPWYAPPCVSTAAPVTLATEFAAHAAMNGSTRLPIRPLHGAKLGGNQMRHMVKFKR